MKNLIVVLILILVVAGCIRVIINVSGRDVTHKQEVDMDAANINTQKEPK